MHSAQWAAQAVFTRQRACKKCLTTAPFTYLPEAGINPDRRHPIVEYSDHDSPTWRALLAWTSQILPSMSCNAAMTVYVLHIGTAHGSEAARQQRKCQRIDPPVLATTDRCQHHHRRAPAMDRAATLHSYAQDTRIQDAPRSLLRGGSQQRCESEFDSPHLTVYFSKIDVSSTNPCCSHRAIARDVVALLAIAVLADPPQILRVVIKHADMLELYLAS